MFSPGVLLHNRYRILRVVDKGSQGTIYQARDEILGRTVALKSATYSDDFPEAVLEGEARLLANLGTHPVLPTVFDYFSEDNCQILVMEFIAGDDLVTLLKKTEHGFPIQQVLSWAEQLLSALQFMHNSLPPIIHRDIKPKNMKLNDKGGITLLDFGLAKDLTNGTRISGFTPAYAPLEQLHGLPTDARSDIYSLAASLYHLATNLKPVDAMLRQTALSRQQPDPLRPLHEIKAEIPHHVSQGLMQAMSIEMNARPSTAAEFRNLLHLANHNQDSQDTDETITLAASAQTDVKDEIEIINYRWVGRAGGQILSLAFAPHGLLLASGGWDKMIRIWNLTTGESEVLGRCTGPVNSVSFSPDGKLLASASNTIDIWDIQTGELIKQFNQFGFCVAFSPKGRCLAWSSKSGSATDGAICTWNIESNLCEVIGTSPRWIRSLAFSPDGDGLVSGTRGFSKSISLWSILTKEQRYLFEHSDYGVDSVAMSGDGRFIAAGGRFITLLEVERDQIQKMGTYDDDICSIAFSPDSNSIVSGGRAVCIWSVESGQKRILKEPNVYINAVAFSPEGHKVAAGSNDGTVFLVNVQ